MSIDRKEEEQIPLLFIWSFITRHKKIAIGTTIILILAIGGFYAYKNYKEKKEVEEYFQHSLNHLVEIIGVYKNSNIILALKADNTAVLTTNYGKYNEAQHLGHWKETTEGYPITIVFSNSFKASICGRYDDYFSMLYFFDGDLWESLDAIQSKDYNAREHLTKDSK